MRRREFHQLAVAGAFACAGIVPRQILGAERELGADLAIVGGGVGGCAAALAAARAGLRVVMTEETDWIGGQLTQQAVPPDEHPWIESFGCTRSYRQFRDFVRDYYRRHYPLTPDAYARVRLNPGNGGVSRLCHEPQVALAVLEEMLAPHVSSGRLRILLNHEPISAEVDGDRVRAIQVRDRDSGDLRTLVAPYFIDATELGDLLPLANVEHVVGAESQAETGEPHAAATADPLNQQAITCCFAMDYLDGEDHTIERPAEYAFWRDYSPELRPAWPGKLLSLACSDPKTLEVRRTGFNPAGDTDGMNFWVYRRIADPVNFAAGTYGGGVTLVNWPMNDYWLGPLVGVPANERANHIRRAKQLSLSLIYWLQTEAPRPDGGTGWKGLRLREDLVGTSDGLAKYPYIRESRRIRAEFTALEQHVGADARMKETGLPAESVSAATFADSVGIGAYRIDLHPSTGGDNYIDFSSLPFQIPLGALLPVRVDNLLPGGKNLGVTHVTNGAYRLHPVEWNIGEAAGALAAHCLRTGERPRAIRANAQRLADFQAKLRDQGLELEWPRLRPL
ncbi:MAG: FAD-dependent oxidoreductase [Planctomycetia bacterium]|nr:FAD-dependent oxidoreductase [Planctomycetia bacterium]